jgi:hypothetical protein
MQGLTRAPVVTRDSPAHPTPLIASTPRQASHHLARPGTPNQPRHDQGTGRLPTGKEQAPRDARRVPYGDALVTQCRIVVSVGPTGPERSSACGPPGQSQPGSSRAQIMKYPEGQARLRGPRLAGCTHVARAVGTDPGDGPADDELDHLHGAGRLALDPGDGGMQERGQVGDWLTPRRGLMRSRAAALVRDHGGMVLVREVGSCLAGG